MASYGHLNLQVNTFQILKRSNTILYWKKAIRNYILIGNLALDEITLREDPTKFKEVNDCIKDVMKAENQNHGVPTIASCTMEYMEFLNLLDIERKKASSTGDEYRRNILKWIRLLSLLMLQ